MSENLMDSRGKSCLATDDASCWKEESNTLDPSYVTSRQES